MKSGLSSEVLNKLVGHSVKITKGKTANGKSKDGLTICKLLSVNGDKATVVPKGHRRAETINSDRICIWKKGLHLGNMKEEDILLLIGDDAQKLNGNLIPSLKSAVNEKYEHIKGDRLMVSEVKEVKEVKKQKYKPSGGEYSVEEVCEILNKSRSAIYNLKNKGELTGRRGVIDEHSVNDYLNRKFGSKEQSSSSKVEKPKAEIPKPKAEEQEEVAIDKIEMFDQMSELFKQRDELKTQYDAAKAELEKIEAQIKQNNKDIIAASKLVSE